jgi:hypothetical protein
MTRFFLQQIDEEKSESTIDIYKLLCDAKRHYLELAEAYPKRKFKIIRQEVLNSVVAETDDYRQTSFDLGV